MLRKICSSEFFNSSYPASATNSSGEKSNQNPSDNAQYILSGALSLKDIDEIDSINLRELTIDSTKNTNTKVWDALIKLINSSPKLTSLKISNANLRYPELNRLLSILPACKELKQLNLSDNPDAFVKNFEGYPDSTPRSNLKDLLCSRDRIQLQELYLSNCGLALDELVSLAECVAPKGSERSTSLIVMDLSKNNFNQVRKESRFEFLCGLPNFPSRLNAAAKHDIEKGLELNKGYCKRIVL